MGADVTVLSQSLKKQDDGLRLGADHYHATSDAETFGKLAGTFDLILNTVSATINVDAYLSLLALDGVLANVGVATEPPSLNFPTLVSRRRIVTGSLIGGLREPARCSASPRTQPGRGDRSHPGREDKRGIRASPGLRRAIPVRHRQLHLGRTEVKARTRFAVADVVLMHRIFLSAGSAGRGFR